jgi:hypothetical protein
MQGVTILGVPADVAVLVLIAFVTDVLWAVALVDCLGRRFARRSARGDWVLVIVFLPCLGALVYWFVGRPQGVKP